MININKNKGMYAEDIINKTADYYLYNEIAYISKRHLPIKIINKNKNKINGILYEKSSVDYNVLYKGFYADFEVKETNKNFFDLTNLKKHQENHLSFISKLQGISFLIICFIQEDKFFIISFDKLEKIKKMKINKISFDFCNKELYKLKIIFPGILNIIDFLEYNISKNIIV